MQQISEVSFDGYLNAAPPDEKLKNGESQRSNIRKRSTTQPPTDN